MTNLTITERTPFAETRTLLVNVATGTHGVPQIHIDSAIKVLLRENGWTLEEFLCELLRGHAELPASTEIVAASLQRSACDTTECETLCCQGERHHCSCCPISR